MSKRTSEPIDPEVERRCARVLDIAFRGIHNVAWYTRKALYLGMQVTTGQDLSTYDFDILTRLVVAAHDEAVRISIDNGGPGRIAIKMWPRQREGSSSERHPTMEQAVELVRKWGKWEVKP